uniref:Uncharacterized protein n=1 Tax=Triticum urartu TaxID=4572 RepID=A0A8R7TR10_TRIUA
MIWSYNLQNDPTPKTCTQCVTLVLDQSQSDNWTRRAQAGQRARFCKYPLPLLVINNAAFVARGPRLLPAPQRLIWS